jgi:hypothetical protein
VSSSCWWCLDDVLLLAPLVVLFVVLFVVLDLLFLLCLFRLVLQRLALCLLLVEDEKNNVNTADVVMNKIADNDGLHDMLLFLFCRMYINQSIS